MRRMTNLAVVVTLTGSLVVATNSSAQALQAPPVPAPVIGLATDVADTWNLVDIKHRGRHPAEYHKWVYDNMVRADAVAAGDSVTILALFKSWVTDVVAADPSITRLAYWKCYR